MRARRISASDLGLLSPDDLAGAVLLGGIRLPDRSLAKGTKLGTDDARDVVRAAAEGRLGDPVRVAWAEPGDLHENEAAERLALAVGGAGVVLHVRVLPLSRVNAIDPLEVFTLYHGQAVPAARVVASVKVAPHVVPEEAVQRGVRIAREDGPLVDVRPYLPLEVGAIAAEALRPDDLARFEAGAPAKIEALGSRFAGTTVVRDRDPDAAERGSRRALEELVHGRGLPVVLVGGVSAGDPLAPFFAALEGLGGGGLRRGGPGQPG